MISVIIPAHNREMMLKRSICSVLGQIYPDFELIVVDDGSTTSLAPIKALVEDAGHSYVKTEHRGVSAARNHGVALSKGAWLAFLDSDDVWLPEKLARQVEFHEQNPEHLISQTDEIWIRNGKRVNKKKHHVMAEGKAFALSLKQCAISPSSVMMARDLFTSLGGFDEDMAVCEDYDLWLRITLNHEVGLIKDNLIEKYGGHEEQLSKSCPAIDRYRVYAILKLLLRENLSWDSLKLSLEELILKTQILLQGAQKHDCNRVAFYRELLSSAQEFLENREGFFEEKKAILEEFMHEIAAHFIDKKQERLENV